MGRALGERGDAPPRAFISHHQSLGSSKSDVLPVLRPGRRIEACAIDPVTLAATPRPVDARVSEEAIADDQTAARSFSEGLLVAPWWRAAKMGSGVISPFRPEAPLRRK